MKMLIVEDDPGLAKVLRKALSEAGYTPTVCGNGTEAYTLLQAVTFDLLVLDVMLPGMDGFGLCRAARAAKVTAPILLLTACDALNDKVNGLDAGADDYMAKPFQIAELLARVRALLRRGTVAPTTTLTVGDLTLDPAKREARRGDREIRLSATEYALLEYLMRNAGRVLTRSLILEYVWQFDFGGSDNVLDVYIGYLRAKIDKGFTRPLIRTVRGVGFVIDSGREA